MASLEMNDRIMIAARVTMQQHGYSGLLGAEYDELTQEGST